MALILLNSQTDTIAFPDTNTAGASRNGEKNAKTSEFYAALTEAVHSDITESSGADKNEKSKEKKTLSNIPDVEDKSDPNKDTSDGLVLQTAYYLNIPADTTTKPQQDIHSGTGKMTYEIFDSLSTRNSSEPDVYLSEEYDRISDLLSISELISETPSTTEPVENAASFFELIHSADLSKKGNETIIKNETDDKSGTVIDMLPPAEESKPSGGAGAAEGNFMDSHNDQEDGKSTDGDDAADNKTKINPFEISRRVDVSPERVSASEAMKSEAAIPVSRLYDAIIDDVAYLQEKGEMTINLNPRFLGKVALKLTMGDEGMTVKITVDDPTVKAMLASQTDRLADSMRSSVPVESIDVVYEGFPGGTNGGSNASPNDDSEFGRRRNRLPAIKYRGIEGVSTGDDKEIDQLEEMGISSICRSA